MKCAGIGSDIEGIAKRGNTPISVLDKLTGTKRKPESLPNGGALQADGVLPEYNLPVATFPEAFKEALIETQFWATKALDEYGLRLHHESSITYARDQLQHPNAMVNGCEVDYNAWSGKINPKITNNGLTADKWYGGLRTTGGHLHFSWYLPHSKPQSIKALVFKVVRYMDMAEGLRSLFWDKDTIRRQLYGKAGACRVKDYGNGFIGGEYRVLSSFWANPLYQGEYAAKLAKTLHYVASNIEDLEEPPPVVEEIINNNDLDGATSILSSKGIEI